MSLEIKKGVFFLDKPYYINSNKSIKIIQQYMELKKIGYSGTLDPIATGLLPVLINKATCLSDTIVEKKKSYTVNFSLLKITDTFDSDGSLLKKKEIFNSNFFLKKIIDIGSIFVGKILQTPPVYSSIKYKGKNLYQYARYCLETKIKKRQVKIYSITIIKLKKDNVTLSIICSKGTYIRSLVSDIGYILGHGAYISNLERIKIGLYNKQDIINFNQFKIIQKYNKKKYIKYFLYKFK